jgi:two-component response regulator (ARR-B family)
MGGSDQRKGKEPALFDDKFPEGMRILVVDDNPVCLKVLEVFLHCCKYKRELESPSPPFPQYIRINGHVIFISMVTATTVMDARTALSMLRNGGEEQFDLVITNVHMPDMDGFELLKLIGLEMDLPIISNTTLFLYMSNFAILCFN